MPLAELLLVEEEDPICLATLLSELRVDDEPLTEDDELLFEDELLTEVEDLSDEVPLTEDDDLLSEEELLTEDDPLTDDEEPLLLLRLLS